MLLQDITDDHPEFLGFVQAVDVRPHEGQQGRWLDVQAIGIECLLDWMMIGSLPITTQYSTGPLAAAGSDGSQRSAALREGRGAGHASYTHRD